MSSALRQKSFQEGFNSRLTQLAKIQIKRAGVIAEGLEGLGSQLAKPFVDPTRASELKVLGERVFRDSRNPNVGVWRGLISSLLPSYHQLHDANVLRGAHLSNVARLKAQMQLADPVTKQMLIRQIREAAHLHRMNSGELFSQIGATAEPRIRAAKGVGIGAGVAGVGGLGWMGGKALGNLEGEGQDKYEMANMPLIERLKFLALPQQTAYAHRPWSPFAEQPTQ